MCNNRINFVMYEKSHTYIYYKTYMCGFFMDKKDLRSRITEAGGMPKDVLLGASLVTITGEQEACIENYRGILEYTDRLIRIQTRRGRIHVSGRGLQIEYYNNDEMKITGHITVIEFHEGG